MSHVHRIESIGRIMQAGTPNANGVIFDRDIMGVRCACGVSGTCEEGVDGVEWCEPPTTVVVEVKVEARHIEPFPWDEEAP